MDDFRVQFSLRFQKESKCKDFAVISSNFNIRLSSLKVAYYSFIRVQEVYTINVQISFIFFASIF